MCYKYLFSSLESQSGTWGIQLGQLLLSAKKQDNETFYQKLKLVRKEQVVPLSAASYERGTYQRGYEYIVRSVSKSHHIIAKFSDGVNQKSVFCVF